MPYFLRHLATDPDQEAPVLEPAALRHLDTFPGLVWVADAKGRLVHANEAWLDFTGLEPGADLVAEASELVHPDDRARVTGSAEGSSGQSTSFEFRLRRHDGVYHWVTERIAPWRDRRGALLGYVGGAIDIDQQKRHEQRLSLIALRQTSLACFGRFILEQAEAEKVAAEALRLYCEHMRLPAGLLLRPADGEAGPLEVAGARGLPEGASPPRLAAVEPRAIALQLPEDAAEFPVDPDWIEECGWRHGLAVPVDPLAPSRGCFVGFAPEPPDPQPSLHYARELAAIFAVSEARDRAERSLRAGNERALQLQKIEAVGLLAGGVAHDFNNLLTAIRCFGELLREDLPGEAQRARVDDILHAASRASHLVRQLLAFSRHELVQTEPVDLLTLVDNLRGFIRSLLSEHVRIEFELGGESAWCRADPKQIEQVLFNLCLNARDVMLVEGVLTVSVGAGPAALDGGRQVRLSVRDTGHGMPPEVRARLFQPFFTTKPRGRGTGLGLAASRAIARELGGELSFESELGRGTVFHLDLPEIACPYTLEPTAEAPEETRPAARMILLVEDDDLVRAVTLLLAESLGHKVMPFGESREALAWAEAGGLSTIDLLLTDVVMPEINGHTLAQRLRKLRPELPVLYMSGYVDDEATRTAIEQPGVMFLAKPFSHHEFTHRLQAILAPATV